MFLFVFKVYLCDKIFFIHSQATFLSPVSCSDISIFFVWNKLDSFGSIKQQIMKCVWFHKRLWISAALTRHSHIIDGIRFKMGKSQAAVLDSPPRPLYHYIPIWLLIRTVFLKTGRKLYEIEKYALKMYIKRQAFIGSESCSNLF